MITPESDIGALERIGPATAAKFRGLGISTVRDLIYYFPRAYEDRTHVRKIIEVLSEEKVSVVATVTRAPLEYAPRRG
jgi:ATP-dependent DNA helicase RecG